MRALDPWGPFLWDFRYWALWNKWNIFAGFGLLKKWELFLWRVPRLKHCPEWFRGFWERYLTARLKAGFR